MQILKKKSFSSHSLRLLLLFILLIPAFALLGGCSGKDMPGTSSNDNTSMAPMSSMPAEVKDAPTTVQQAYQFAVSNPDALKNVPCYCGCGTVGHKNNYDCYVKELTPSGEIVFDPHALGCSICVDITQDVMKMTRQGKSPGETRSVIDGTYAQYGPSNMPPVQ